MVGAFLECFDVILDRAEALGVFSLLRCARLPHANPLRLGRDFTHSVWIRYAYSRLGWSGGPISFPMFGFGYEGLIYATR